MIHIEILLQKQRAFILLIDHNIKIFKDLIAEVNNSCHYSLTHVKILDKTKKIVMVYPLYRN